MLTFTVSDTDMTNCQPVEKFLQVNCITKRIQIQWSDGSKSWELARNLFTDLQSSILILAFERHLARLPAVEYIGSRPDRRDEEKLTPVHTDIQHVHHETRKFIHPHYHQMSYIHALG